MFKMIAIFAGTLFVLLGCQTVPYQGQARDVKKRAQDGGVIAIAANHRDEDRAKADEKMRATCAPYIVQVVEEGEVVVGQSTTSDAKETDRASTERNSKLFGLNLKSGEAAGKNVSSTSTTTALKEWQISYKCEKKKASAQR